MKHLLLLICFLTSQAFAQQGGSFQYIKLLPKPLPTTCAPGDLRSDSSGHFLNYCFPANTWNAFGVSSTAPLTTLGDMMYENSTPLPTRLAGNTTATKKFLSQTGNGTISAAPVWGQPACSDISNAVASCSTDATNASNISSGTLGAARLPNPTASTLGGVESLASTTHQWINTISTSGVPSSTQPAFSDISGVATNAQTTAASINTASAIVARDGSGNFAAGTITAALTGTASGNTTYTANNHGVVVSGSGNAMTVIAPNASTAFPLVSGGVSADPTWALLGIAGGGTNASTVTTSPAATAWAGWDANKNFTANNNIQSYTTTATAAGTTTLLVGSTALQYFTGATTQTVKMPVASTLVTGQQFNIVNLSSGVVTVQSSGANTIQAMAANSQLYLTVILASGTGTASWSWFYTPVANSLPLTNPMTTGGDIIYGGASGTPTRLANGSATQVLTSNGTTLAPSWQAAGSSPTTTYYNGWTGGGASWSTASATFVDPTVSGTPTLTSRFSNGITVTQGGSSVPGITFTPSASTAIYWINCVVNGVADATNNATSILLTDGTHDISTAMNIGLANPSGLTLGGIYVPASASAVTVKLQMASTSGTASLSTPGGPSKLIEWSIIQLK